jgi:hypothetical protein
MPVGTEYSDVSINDVILNVCFSIHKMETAKPALLLFLSDLSLFPASLILSSRMLTPKST